MDMTISQRVQGAFYGITTSKHLKNTVYWLMRLADDLNIDISKCPICYDEAATQSAIFFLVSAILSTEV